MHEHTVSLMIKESQCDIASYIAIVTYVAS